MDIIDVTCPSCFEVFSVPVPPAAELPAELDYDCEVCCCPMFIMISENGAEAKSHDNL